MDDKKWFLAIFLLLWILYFLPSTRINNKLSTLSSSSSSSFNIPNVSSIKSGNKWIVVTSVQSPTDDVKRLAKIDDWNLVVVADIKTPIDWSLNGVHFLSIDFQKSLPFSIISSLPSNSYTRKNIGYLYAISQRAEWIYDTDDDNKPFGKGLEQFDFGETSMVSGVRFRPSILDKDLKSKIFNPYRFFGLKNMWPRGFPLEYLKDHQNAKDATILCKSMPRASVQQGLVHHDPDVDAIYRLINADRKTGLNERFNKFAPTITLSPGTFSPWNSQNTLFHRSAFHTLFLPTTVSFRTTDIWRSLFAQKILHLSQLTIAFTQMNAIQFRNSHNFLNDFIDEKQVYTDSGKILEFLHTWQCSSTDVSVCIIELANQFVIEKFWRRDDLKMIQLFLNDLKFLKFEFPEILQSAFDNESLYQNMENEKSKDINCRRANFEFELDYPEDPTKPALQRAEKKIDYFGDVVDWCSVGGYQNLSRMMPSPRQLADYHSKDYVLRSNLNNVLIITNNYEWKMGIGLLQRLYQPYFATLIFCGTWNETKYNETDTSFPRIVHPFNYIHMNPMEMYRGYKAYHCLTLVKQMRLNNVDGYFMMSDDTHFNIWQRIDFRRVHHLEGVQWLTSSLSWSGANGLAAARKIVKRVESTSDEHLKNVWQQFERRLRKFGYITENQTAAHDMLLGKSRSVSDFFYVPTSEIQYYADLMSIFYENELFHEIAISRFLRSTRHQTSRELQKVYLRKNRNQWMKIYNVEMIGIHPIKLSYFHDVNSKNRTLYCSTLIQSYSNILMGGSKNYSVKNDDDPDWMNG